MLIDAHCHINSLSREQYQYFFSQAEGKLLCLDSSIDPDSSKKSLVLSAETDFIRSCIGFHPFSLDQFGRDTMDIYLSFIKGNDKVAAVGEVGLDCKAPFSLDNQAEILRKFIELAQSLNLPLVVHNRLDSQMILDILDEYYQSFVPVIFHCFSQDEAFADRVLEKDGTFSFSLNVLRKNSQSRKLLSYVPLDNMILETDSPYMKIKGRGSTPMDVEKVYQFAAEAKNIAFQDLEQKILENAQKVFNI